MGNIISTNASYYFLTISSLDIKKLRAHKDYEQVVLDVNRSLKRFPPGMDDDVRLSLQDQLVELIMRVLVRNRDLHYYQVSHV